MEMVNIKKDTRTKILEATIKVLTEKDITEVTTRSIAKEAGVSKGTLFHYFNTKDSLMYYATEKIYLDLLNSLVQISLKIKTEDIIRTITYEILDFFTKTPGMMRLLLNILSTIEHDPDNTTTKKVSRNSVIETFLTPLYTESAKIFELIGFKNSYTMARLYIGIVDGIGFQIDAEKIPPGDPILTEFAEQIISLFTPNNPNE